MNINDFKVGKKVYCYFPLGSIKVGSLLCCSSDKKKVKVKWMTGTISTFDIEDIFLTFDEATRYKKEKEPDRIKIVQNMDKADFANTTKEALSFYLEKKMKESPEVIAAWSSTLDNIINTPQNINFFEAKK